MNRIRIRMFNNEGMRRFEECLDAFESDAGRPIADIQSLLKSSDATEHVPHVVEADAERVFERRFDLAQHLHERVPRLGLSDPTRDRGLWAWLAALWFEQLAPLERGKRKVGERAKWIPQQGWKYYRHVVLGPYLLYQANHDRPERAMAVLFNPPHTPGELVGQLAAKQAIYQSRGVLGAASSLFYDPIKGKLKRGAGGQSARRFNAVLEQFDRTYDLQLLQEDALLRLLPKEFARFRVR